MNAPKEILAKIAKLLRLAKSSNPNEAAAALAKAMELAAEHRVALDSVSTDEAEEAKRTSHHETELFERLSYDRKFAMMIVREFFRVEPVLVQGIREDRYGFPRVGTRITFVGAQCDLTIAIYVYDFLLQRFRYCWTHHRGRLRSRPSFVEGMFQGICSRLDEARPQTAREESTALVLSFKKYIGDNFGPTQPTKVDLPDTDASAARVAGFGHGRRTEIRTPLGDSAAATLALPC